MGSFLSLIPGKQWKVRELQRRCQYKNVEEELHLYVWGMCGHDSVVLSCLGVWKPEVYKPP